MIHHTTHNVGKNVINVCHPAHLHCVGLGYLTVCEHLNRLASRMNVKPSALWNEWHTLTRQVPNSSAVSWDFELVGVYLTFAESCVVQDLIRFHRGINISPLVNRVFQYSNLNTGQSIVISYISQ